MPALVLATSFYYSILFTVGIIIGYVGCKLFYRKFVKSGKVDLIFLDFGKWKIHVHHWILGAIFLILAWFIDWFYLPSFFVAVVLGVMAHDIYDFNDWHKIIFKEGAYQKVSSE